jgi:hypothetical protein
MLAIVKASQLRERPRLEQWHLVAQDLVQCLTQARHLAGGPRRPSSNHDKALSENMQGLMWVTVDCNSPGVLVHAVQSTVAPACRICNETLVQTFARHLVCTHILANAQVLRWPMLTRTGIAP